MKIYVMWCMPQPHMKREHNLHQSEKYLWLAIDSGSTGGKEWNENG